MSWLILLRRKLRSLVCKGKWSKFDKMPPRSIISLAFPLLSSHLYNPSPYRATRRRWLVGFIRYFLLLTWVNIAAIVFDFISVNGSGSSSLIVNVDFANCKYFRCCGVFPWFQGLWDDMSIVFRAGNKLSDSSSASH